VFGVGEGRQLKGGEGIYNYARDETSWNLGLANYEYEDARNRTLY